MVRKYISPNKIAQIADEVRIDSLGKQLADEIAETDIYQICQYLGCKIETVEFNPSNVFARVLRNDEQTGKYIIQVAKNDSVKRQKFSIAHEIAHIILHYDERNNEFIELRQSLVDYEPEELYKEVQANMFASALLLPENQVKTAWEISKSIDDLAEMFNVSKDAMYNRLCNLGFLNDE